MGLIPWNMCVVDSRGSMCVFSSNTGAPRSDPNNGFFVSLYTGGNHGRCWETFYVFLLIVV